MPAREWTLWCVALLLLQTHAGHAQIGTSNNVINYAGDSADVEPNKLSNVLVVKTNIVVSDCHDDDDDDDDDDSEGCADSTPDVPDNAVQPISSPRSSDTIMVADLDSSHDTYVVRLSDPPVTTASTTSYTTRPVSTATPTSTFPSTVRVTTIPSTSTTTATVVKTTKTTAATTTETAAAATTPATTAPPTTPFSETAITETTTGAATTTPLPTSTSTFTVTTPTVTNGDMCTGCVMTNGVGYVPHPSDCSRFYQCYHSDVSTTVSREKSCPTGLYWNQAVLTCDFPGNVPCAQDVCATGRPLTVDCRNYWDCSTGSATAKCCPLYQSYDITSGSCKTNVTCTVACLMAGDTPDAPCDLRPVAGDKHVFEQRTSAGSWVRHRCPLFTAYSEGNCGCAFIAPQNYNKACRPEMYLPFDVNTDDMSGKSVHVGNEGVTVSRGSAVFDGKSRLVVNRFSNAWFGSTVVITLRFKAAGYASRHALVCNGDCGVSPSLYIGSNSDSTTEFFAKTYSSPAVNFTLPQSGGGWQEVEYVLADGALQGRAAGLWSSHNATGSLETRQRALMIGGCEGAEGFQGHIDQVAVYFCNPGTA
ncbi:mucin-4-like isoform X2 [Haliotis rufescens]|nr:mucin-4-like isoform X2 [Haliotis rufescens]